MNNYNKREEKAAIDLVKMGSDFFSVEVSTKLQNQALLLESLIHLLCLDQTDLSRMFPF
jgi:hypothetical protein